MPQYPIHQSESKRVVLSLGGSLIVPEQVNVKYLIAFRKFILGQLEQGWRFFIITGGGSQAKDYIDAASKIMGKEITKDDKDWLGIHATRFNAHLIRTIFRDQAQPEIITDPETDELSDAKIIVAGGWKPGWSTDFVAGKIAQRVKAPYIINLSNIDQVYDDDPRKNPNAKPIDKITWADFRKMVGDEWTPRMNTPYDPIAAKLAEEEGQTVLVINGENLKNLKNIFETGNFKGTVIAKK